MTCAVFVLLLGVIVLDRWSVSREPLARDRLRQARIDLQRAESLHATLAASPTRLQAMEMSEETLSLAILEQAGRAGGLPGVSGLQYRLSSEGGEMRTLRLTVQARVLDEDILLRLLDTLRTTSVSRPRRVAGCRVLRTPAPERHRAGSAGTAPADLATLALECAIDWSWWPVA